MPPLERTRPRERGRLALAYGGRRSRAALGRGGPMTCPRVWKTPGAFAFARVTLPLRDRSGGRAGDIRQAAIR